MSHLCAMCKLTFPSREVFYAHIKKHPRCLSCNKYFKDTESLKKHYRETACTLSSIENATQTVYKNTLKQAPTGSKGELSFANLQPVLKQEREIDPVPSIYKNKQLKQPSFSSSNQPPSQSPGICSLCNSAFLTQKLLDLHNQNIHGHIKCQICNQTFIDGNSLENHQFSTKPGFLFKCCICRVAHNEGILENVTSLGGLGFILGQIVQCKKKLKFEEYSRPPVNEKGHFHKSYRFCIKLCSYRANNFPLEW